MLEKPKIKIDEFYIILGILLIVLSALVIISLNSIFSALATSGEIDEELLKALTPRVDKAQLDEAYEAAFSREIKRLDLKE